MTSDSHYTEAEAEQWNGRPSSDLPLSRLIIAYAPQLICFRSMSNFVSYFQVLLVLRFAAMKRTQAESPCVQFWSPTGRLWDYWSALSKCKLPQDWRSVSMSWCRAPLRDLRPDTTSCRKVAVWNVRSCFFWAPLWRGDGSAICSVITQCS
jgi:hypothetical protein